MTLREARFDRVRPGRGPAPPATPARWAPVPAAFLAALHEAGRTPATGPRSPGPAANATGGGGVDFSHG